MNGLMGRWLSLHSWFPSNTSCQANYWTHLTISREDLHFYHVREQPLHLIQIQPLCSIQELLVEYRTGLYELLNNQYTFPLPNRILYNSVYVLSITLYMTSYTYMQYNCSCIISITQYMGYYYVYTIIGYVSISYITIRYNVYITV